MGMVKCSSLMLAIIALSSGKLEEKYRGMIKSLIAIAAPYMSQVAAV